MRFPRRSVGGLIITSLLHDVRSPTVERSQSPRPLFASQCLPCSAAGDLPGARSDCGVLSGLTIALAITSRVPYNQFRN
jgi:hypothetical protein